MDKSVYTHNEFQQLINKLNEVTTAKRFWIGSVWRRSARVVGAVGYIEGTISISDYVGYASKFNELYLCL